MSRLSSEAYTVESADVLIVCARVGVEGHGYLICAETRSQRLWQEKESAIIYFLARELMHKA